MARGDQLLRQWNLLKTLQTRGEGVPLARLADDLGVSERTIQRDFEVLQELGFPVEHADDEYGKRYWKMPHDFFRAGPFVLGPTEAVSLVLARQLFEPVAGTHLAEGLDSVIEKIRTCMPEKALQHFANVDVLTYVPRFGLTDHKPHAGKIKLLIEAARSRLSVRIAYRPVWKGTAFDTLFDPYGLIVFDGNLFAVGRSHHRNDVRILKVVRIQQIEGTDRRFKRPADFNVSDHFEHSFGLVHGAGEPVKITVKFTGRAATLVEERTWHQTQELERLAPGPTLFEADGSDGEPLLATFRLAEVSVFKSWIKGFGEHAEVLKPAWLRREIREELLAAARRYDG